MFINPMWESEVQRIGKRRCTPTGYCLHLISDLIGLLALGGTLAMAIYCLILHVRGNFDASLLWRLLVPFAAAVIGNLLYHYSWYLAGRRQFQWDREQGFASWVDDHGKVQSYRAEDSPDQRER